jgi:hypothetical protein
LFGTLVPLPACVLVVVAVALHHLSRQTICGHQKQASRASKMLIVVVVFVVVVVKQPVPRCPWCWGAKAVCAATNTTAVDFGVVQPYICELSLS